MDLPVFSKPATELIRERYSCRVFESERLQADKVEELTRFVAALELGPRGGKPRFELIAASPEDPSALRGLGTYGFIQNPSAFLAVAKPADLNLVDLGWATELAVLKATEMGIGSCWLGGTFNRSRFAKAAHVGRGERLAIVVALGLEAPGARDAAIRHVIAGKSRKPWAEIFFDGSLGRPIADPAELNPLALDPGWAEVFEAFRLSPSGSNKQPWALIRGPQGWELFLRRRRGYGRDLARLAGVADVRMNDMGIAMVHLALAAREKGIAGEWGSAPAPEGASDTGAIYVATFG
jgi:nitroreductase